MARGRMIDREIYAHEILNEFDIETRYFYIGLIIWADDEGRLKANPKYLKAKIFPYDNQMSTNITDMVNQLATNGCILVYEVDGARYIQHPKWSNWQTIRKDRKQPSDCPSPSKGNQVSTKSQPTGNQMSTECPPNLTKPNLTKPNLTKPNLTKPKETTYPTDMVIKDTSLLKVDAEIQKKEETPQASFVNSFKKTYEGMVNQPFKAGKEHYIMVAKLIKDYGLEAVILKAKLLGYLCENRSAWFTKSGWADYRLETLSKHWNSILEQDSQESKDRELLNDLRREEAKNAELNRLINGK